MHLKIKAENDIIHMRYEDHTNYHVGDSGLDLFVPEEIVVPANAIGFQINHLISCEPFVDASKQNGMSYMLYPRSSMGARTPLRLSNSVGIMDAGYRGNVIRVEAGTRLVQICDPTLQPITFEMVNSLSETTRGEGGLGSTG